MNQRTSLVLDQELYREVKAEAANSGQTVSSVLEAALRFYLELRSIREEDPGLVQLSTGGGLKPGIDLYNKEQIAALLDVEDFAKLHI
ncbi:MAG: ribbon-helix-helix domain-containing protein [Actinomycetia bacterium]|jgi:hypothetical protein|nr:ribbon-helix-helix domain-containing protein [Actinomycetes bacterium]